MKEGMFSLLERQHTQNRIILTLIVVDPHGYALQVVVSWPWVHLCGTFLLPSEDLLEAFGIFEAEAAEKGH